MWRKILVWENTSVKQVEPSSLPVFFFSQDFTGVPVTVDLAAMSDAMHELSSDPNQINPLVYVDLVIDHSVQVDLARSENASQANMEFEFQRNIERFAFLIWGSTAFHNMLIIPPGSALFTRLIWNILSGLFSTQRASSTLDSVVGTDSHTTMSDGLGVAGWGVGGIETEATMLGQVNSEATFIWANIQPMGMVLPGVVGFKLFGKLCDSVTATNLVLTITQMLRKHGVVGKFVEFYGNGVSEFSLPDRVTIANMSPEYGATMVSSR